jgi:hypothetical protein
MNNNEKRNTVPPLLEGIQGIVSKIPLDQNELRDDQIMNVSTLLICIKGRIIYEDEMRLAVLMRGDFIHVESLMIYSLKALTKSELLLIN